MSRMHIIGLTGPQGVGKDTVADLLVTHARFQKIAFGDALRAEVSQGYGVSIEDLTKRETKEQPQERFALERCVDNNFVGAILSHQARTQGKALDVVTLLEAPRSPREILRWWGTEFRRAQAENYWTGALIQRINYVNRELGVGRFVVTDVRFDNEADLIRRFGGCIWQIKRPGIEANGQHVSEVTGDEFKPDAVINNAHEVRHLQGLVLAEWLAEEAGLDEAAQRQVGHALICRGTAC